MKKVLLGLLLLVSGCTQRPQYYLYLYYAKTCPVCKSFINNVIPTLEAEYGNQMLITQYDIDEEESLDHYAKTCSLLKEYYATEGSGSVPFIVLDGYFAQVGYEIGSDEEMIENIHNAIAGKEINKDQKEIYEFQEGKTFH